jgi:hypothetical protein
MSLPLQLYSRLPILEIFSDHSSEFKGPRTEKCVFSHSVWPALGEAMMWLYLNSWSSKMNIY